MAIDGGPDDRHEDHLDRRLDHIERLLTEVARSNRVILEAVEALAAPPVPPAPSPAIGARLTFTGDPAMPTSITVDTANETASVTFVDDKGDTTAAPAGMVVAFASDNPSVLTVAPSPSDQSVGDITPVGAGTANLSVTLTDANGNSPPLEADGTTRWAPIEAAAVSVTAGAAVGARLSLAADPTPAPSPAPAPGPAPSPAPAPAPAAEPATDPVTGTTLYTIPAGDTVGGPWPAASVQGSDGTPLATFTGDTAGQPATGTWPVYDGTTEPIPANPPQPPAS